MFKLSHAALALISGFIWMAVGCSLLPLGLTLLVGNAAPSAHLPLIAKLAPLLGGPEEGALTLIVVGMLVGYLKGRHVLGKSATRGIERIQSLPNPAALSQLYSAKYYLLLGGMMALGFSIKFFGVPNDIRGFIDVAIGAALIQGAMVYLRYAFNNWQKALPG